ncbi:hypothetical protein SAMN05216355_101627 [Actinomyces ruminicola]|uniref:Pilus assembly protein Flp/PilA n=1 Tax=Actinomyces ruminicola TaxID=332524 RepID=A0A1H0A803_9ACTO|nr:hypothetical protein [Actinomyces ruminicola]SDN29758.1 hypothetical protein SAMN05216355_101627 [Actinomyces ruminicola]
MSNSVLAAQVRARMWLDDIKNRATEDGQGAVEYAGLIVIVALVVGLVYAAFNNVDLQGAVEERIDKVLNPGH